MNLHQSQKAIRSVCQSCESTTYLIFNVRISFYWFSNDSTTTGLCWSLERTSIVNCWILILTWSLRGHCREGKTSCGEEIKTPLGFIQYVRAIPESVLFIMAFSLWNIRGLFFQNELWIFQHSSISNVCFSLNEYNLSYVDKGQSTVFLQTYQPQQKLCLEKRLISHFNIFQCLAISLSWPLKQSWVKMVGHHHLAGNRLWRGAV